jgi:hypothetical protein
VNVSLRSNQRVCPVASIPPNNIEEQIRCRAYEVYEARSRDDGHDLDDWLCAECEVIGSAAICRMTIPVHEPPLGARAIESRHS